MGFSLASNAAFEEGEPVIFNGSGSIVEAADDPITVAGIAGGRSTDADGVVWPAGTTVPVYQPVDSQRFVCNNFATDGAGTLVTPTSANASEQTAGFTLTGGGVWVVDTGAVNQLVQIELVLNSRGGSILSPAQSTVGTQVVFRFLT